MDLKGLIEECETQERDVTVKKNLISKEIAYVIKEIIPVEQPKTPGMQRGIHFNEIQEKVNDKFEFKVPYHYLSNAINTIRGISQSEGYYIITHCSE